MTNKEKTNKLLTISTRYFTWFYILFKTKTAVKQGSPYKAEKLNGPKMCEKEPGHLKHFQSMFCFTVSLCIL